MLAPNKDPVDQIIGSRIRFYRLRRRMSQSSLAKQIGVSFQQVQKYENATNRVPSSRLAAISRALHVPVSMFFEAAEDGSISALMLASDSQSLRLAETLMSIGDARLREALVRFVEELAFRRHQEPS
jgi:transcriptional regulator with XRE-family HTH domain